MRDKKIKCLVLDILENCEKLNFIWRKRQTFHILLLLGMDTHKKQKLLLMIYFKSCMRKKESVKQFRSLFLMLSKFGWLIIYPKQFRCPVFMLIYINTSNKTEILDDQSWFERIWYKRHNLLFQDLWVKEFKMSPENFEFVGDLVIENIQKHSTTCRDSIKVEKRIVNGNTIGNWKLI